MPNVLTVDEIDTEAEAADQVMTQAEETAALAAAFKPVSPTDVVGDLSNGGRVGDVTLTMRQNGQKLARGRATVRRSWMWNGTESMLPLAWNPEGTMHDGARRYILKRFCLCCHRGGFYGRRCPQCIKNSCSKCAGSTNMQTQQLGNGQTVQGWIIPCFYLAKEQVPFPARFFGNVDCFLSFCVRRGEWGFLTEQDMRVHARSRHRLEYQAYIESQESAKVDEVTTLRQQVASLMAERRENGGSGPSKPTKRTRKTK